MCRPLSKQHFFFSLEISLSFIVSEVPRFKPGTARCSTVPLSYKRCSSDRSLLGAVENASMSKSVQKWVLVANDVRDGVGQTERAPDGQNDGADFSKGSQTQAQYFLACFFFPIRALIQCTSVSPHTSTDGGLDFSLTPMRNKESNPHQKSCDFHKGPFSGRSTDWAIAAPASQS